MGNKLNVFMCVCMDGWMYGWMDGWMDEQTDAWVNG